MAILLAFLFAISSVLPALADRDIVVSMQLYRWSGHYQSDSYGDREETLDELGPYHLYRMNPDGSHRTRLTHGPFDDDVIAFSPNGKRVLFGREPDGVDFVPDKYDLYVINSAGGKPVRLWSLPQGRHFEAMEWSPDGRTLGMITQTDDYPDKGWLLTLLDIRSRHTQTLADVEYFAWSPDSCKLYLQRIDGKGSILDMRTGKSKPVASPVVDPIWLDDWSIFGDIPQSDPDSPRTDDLARVINIDGTERYRLNIRPAVRMAAEPWTLDEDIGLVSRRPRTWYRIPGAKNCLIGEIAHQMSDGYHYACFRVDLRTGRYWPLPVGLLVGIAPDGKHIAIADNEDWIGSYKSGGERAGPLYIVDLWTGRKKAITGRLIGISGGDWRKR
ncbi:MAG TPA: hypothetical protein VFW40_13520 [Capsulimonadaceae bacterium]|nr:hypothetical protein [Capsulimonadaceae bacterium]